MPELLYEPRINQYEMLIKYCLDTCDAFMFVISDYNNDALFHKRVKPFIKKLEPLKIKSRKNDPRWPGTEASEEIHKYEILFYRCHPSALRYLLQPVSLYNWQYPYFPEDLSFFRQGYCWLSSTAHEEQAYIYTNDDDELSCLKAMGISFREYNLSTIDNRCKMPMEKIIERDNELRFYENYLD